MRGYDDDLEFDDDGEIVERESRLLLPNEYIEDDHEDEPDEKSDDEDNDDPFILTQRIKGPKINQGIVKVRKSALTSDSSLVAFKKSAISQNFDTKKSVDSLDSESRDANTHIYEKIKYKLMLKDVRRRINTENITLRDLKGLLGDVKTLNDASVQIILGVVTDSLKATGHWRDNDQDMVMTQAFPLSQSHNDPRYTGFTKKLIEYGTFYESDDVTPQDVEIDNPSSEIRKKGMVVHNLPVRATPMMHNLMRASPDDLYHQVARRMIDTHFFGDFPEHKKLFTACYFYSLGVEKEWHFDVLMEQGLWLRFFTYKFAVYREERVVLRKLMRGFIDDFYAGNPVVRRALEKRPEPEKRDHKNIWKRFYEVFQGLTIKQKNAVEKVYTDSEPMTYKEAAKDFKITFDSLQSRIKTAFLKFKNEFWEFEGITPKSLSRKQLRAGFQYGGLWRRDDANFKHQLFKVDLGTGLKIQIDWNKLPKLKNLDWKTRAYIKAKIIENCPIPMFHETEYFDGTMPTILSYGRRPGNLTDDPDAKRNQDEGFRHFD